MPSRRVALLAFSLLTFPLIGAGESRAQTITITPDNNPVVAESTVTFVINPKVRSDGDVVNFDFGDGRIATLKYSTDCALIGGCDTVTHAYAGPGTFTVTASGTIGGVAMSGSVKMTVTGVQVENRIFVATGGHIVGFKGVNWRTDVEVHNYGSFVTAYAISLLARDQDNTSPHKVTLSLEPGVTVRFNDILFSMFGFSGAAALMVSSLDNTLLVNSRTYNQLDAGTYGQFVPGVSRLRTIKYGDEARLIQLSHEPSLQTGYRTNLGLLNTTPVTINVEVHFFFGNGAQLPKQIYELKPFEFKQIDKVFEKVLKMTIDDGYITVRTTTVGATFLAYASVVDNITGDPIYIPAVVPD